MLEDRVVPSGFEITTTHLPNWDAGLAGYGLMIKTAEGTGTIAFSLASGSLPQGLQLAGNGWLGGTPTTPGTYDFRLEASDSSTVAFRDYAVTIAPALTLGPPNLAAARFGTPYRQQLTAEGGTGTDRFALTQGALPSGLTLNPGTGLLSGTPLVTGSYSFAVRVQDAVKAVSSQTYTLVVNLAVSPAALPGWDANQAGYRMTIKAAGGTGPLTFGVAAGALPDGLSLNASTGLLSGTPQTTGAFPFTIGVTDAKGASGTQAYAIDINPAPALGAGNLPGGDIGKAYHQRVPLTGGTGPFQFLASLGLPPGLMLGARTGTLSGKPTGSGNFAFMIWVIDAAGLTARQSFAITISPPPTIKTASLPAGTVQSAYSQTIVVARGTAPFTFQSVGSLPPGLTLDATTGLLSGDPTAVGTYSFAVVVTDAAGMVVHRNYKLTIQLITDPNAAFPTPVAARPAYLQTVTDPTFGTQVTRIAGDPGTPVVAANGAAVGAWSADARHNYNLNQAWNATGSLIVIENKLDDGGTPNQLYLNGNTYQVEFSTPSNMPGNGSYDQRWNPNPHYANDVILAGNGSNKLYWFNVVTNKIVRTYTLPMPTTYMGNTKGNTSQNGRFICLGDLTHFFVVDMSAYPTERIGPVFDLNSLGIDGTVSTYSISPSGKYVVVHYNKLNGQSGDFEQVLKVNPQTLALAPQPMSVSWPGMVGNPALGFVYQLGHEDMALNPFRNNADVMIGQEHCGNEGTNVPGIHVVNSDGIGHIVMVQLSNGAVTSLTDPGSNTVASEAYAFHVSCRDIHRPGWCYVSYYNEPGDRYSDELIAVKMDASGAVEQLANLHTANDNGMAQASQDPDFNYRSEAHPVPSPDGRRVIFASNWLYQGTGGEGIQDYVVQLPKMPFLLV